MGLICMLYPHLRVSSLRILRETYSALAPSRHILLVCPSTRCIVVATAMFVINLLFSKPNISSTLLCGKPLLSLVT